MKATRELFFREQSLANLRFLFGKDVDVLTCKLIGGTNVIAIAYKWGSYGERVKVMQGSGASEESALRRLLDLSSKCVQDDLGGQAVYGDLTTCHISLPRFIESASDSDHTALPEDTVVTHDEQVRDARTIEDDVDEVVEAEKNIDEAESPRNLLTPQTSELCHGEQQDYSLLVHVKHPFNQSMGAFRTIRHPSREGLLKVIHQVVAGYGLSNPIWPMQSLFIKKGGNEYDILGYAHDYIGDLFDEIVRSEKLIKVECVYAVGSTGPIPK
ncbi:hypothetical protein ASPBRDRAFT_49601 [Aspergillus brasiliensis CBS 101740]|uniref:Uncharacterized protein n=1 Tax=Aspergillus brasiliensis (strain CBS 101740 / IMI 381727 / IBT 21946) TaxID=767769 RepID=A0A1L9U1Z0_ASPBC|nr:hypothetical protein ASPBRDRAFT_49601 [Aspergillus brasiliensis CBS 101740]